MGPCYRYRRNGRSAIVGRRAENRGSCHVDAARAGESGDPGADRRHHPREGARGPARPDGGVRPPVLPAAGPRGPARAGAGGPVRRRPGPLAPGPPPPARRGQGPGVQPPVRGARLALQALHRGDRHRRHAVPGRLGGHGAEPPRPGHPPAHPPGGRGAPRRGRRAGRGAAARRHRRRPRVVPALRGRPPERPRGARQAALGDRAGPGGRQGLHRGLGRDARAGPDDPARSSTSGRPRSTRPSWPRPGRCWSGSRTTTSPSSATGPTTWSGRTARTCCARCPAPASASCARASPSRPRAASPSCRRRPGGWPASRTSSS